MDLTYIELFQIYLHSLETFEGLRLAASLTSHCTAATLKAAAAYYISWSPPWTWYLFKQPLSTQITVPRALSMILSSAISGIKHLFLRSILGIHAHPIPVQVLAGYLYSLSNNSSAAATNYAMFCYFYSPSLQQRYRYKPGCCTGKSTMSMIKTGNIIML